MVHQWVDVCRLLWPTYFYVTMKLWLNECPISLRCVKDTFLFFRSHSHIKLFFIYLNAKHDRINPTFETDSSLSFLDVHIRKETNAFSISTIRKPTFTSLDTKFPSAINPSYILNLVKCLIDRAYKINSNYVNFCRELYRLREYFCSNGYFFTTIESVICEKLNMLFQPKIVVSDVPEQKMFVKLPFMADQADTYVTHI